MSGPYDPPAPVSGHRVPILIGAFACAESIPGTPTTSPAAADPFNTARRVKSSRRVIVLMSALLRDVESGSFMNPHTRSRTVGAAGGPPSPARGAPPRAGGRPERGAPAPPPVAATRGGGPACAGPPPRTQSRAPR